VVDALFEQVGVRTFDYALRNARPIHIVMNSNIVRIDDMHFIGDGTELEVTGTIDLNDRRIAGLARGTANLGILQGFYRNLRSSGTAELTAQVSGSLDMPVVLGRAQIADGRVRHFSIPHSLEAINGGILFDSRNIRLDGLTATLADGQVVFDGRIGLEGYTPADVSLTATGAVCACDIPRACARKSMPICLSRARGGAAVVRQRHGTERHLDDEVRYWRESVRSWRRRRRSADLAGGPIVEWHAAVRLDVRVIAPGTLRIENNDAHIVSSADLTFRGTYERPVVFGRAEISRGEFIFEGRRYLVTRGSVDFTNPLRIDPTFDIAAETRVRVRGRPTASP
jgi:translocation and assembly module TamB